MNIKDIHYDIKCLIKNNKKKIIILSLIFTLLFAGYNNYIGMTNKSIWHYSISFYYLVLCILKLLLNLYSWLSKEYKYKELVFKIIKILLFILNIFLIIPIVIMVLNKRVIQISLIFSIAIALYTTIKTVRIIIKVIKNKKENNILVNELSAIDIIDVVISILTLQNTLITVNGEYNTNLYILTSISSFIGMLINIIIIYKLKFNNKI